MLKYAQQLQLYDGWKSITLNSISLMPYLGPGKGLSRDLGSIEMRRAKIAGLVVSLIGTVLFSRAYYPVSFAVGYGIREADRSQRWFCWGAVVCAAAFLGCAASIWLGRKQRR